MRSSTPDVLIIGGGLMGAGVAREIRDTQPEATILVVDAGTPIGDVNGLHLHDTDDQALWELYNARVAAGVQARYVGAAATPDIGVSVRGAAPGMYHLTSFGADADELPAAAVAWNAGGMGVHWTAATPTPYGVEIFDFDCPEQWSEDLSAAQRLLRVEADAYGPNQARTTVLAALDEVFGPVSDPGRHVQPMPMAITDVGDRLLRTGPSRIFPPLADGGDPQFDVLVSTVCLRLERRGDRVTAAVLRNLVTDEIYTVAAGVVVVCADAIRTPQLLWASGIRPTALGRHLNEHAFLTGRVLADIDRLGLDLAAMTLPRPGEWCVASNWLPHSDERQPFQGQLMNSVILEEDLKTVTGYQVGLTWYVPTDLVEDNRLEFAADGSTDPAGLPRIQAHFRYTDGDVARIAAGRESQAAAGRRLGRFDSSTDSTVLAPGSSLHYTGTVRMGSTEDGTSVCSTEGRVWGMENLFVAGNGVVPTPLTANSTLPGMVTAVKAARGVSASLR